jgi:hypothetical protein
LGTIKESREDKLFEVGNTIGSESVDSVQERVSVKGATYEKRERIFNYQLVLQYQLLLVENLSGDLKDPADD